jgi:hypothetical protein
MKAGCRNTPHARRRLLGGVAAICTAAALAFPSSAAAQRSAERYALIVTGATGGSQYAERYNTWRDALVTTLREDFGYSDDQLIVLSAEEGGGVRLATRENVRAAVTRLRERVAGDDTVVLVVLIGHGTAEIADGLEGDQAKFNLVGPDLSAAEWTDLLEGLKGRLVFVNAASSSFPFLRTLARPGRIVVTATDIAAQQFETVFPEFFVGAFRDPGADLDKNGRVSIWEAFSYAGEGVKTWFTSRGQLATERPLLDDTGDGVGVEAGSSGPDGALARLVHLQPGVPPAPADPELAELQRQRAGIESQIEALKVRKPDLPPSEYETRLEALLLELARVEQRLRERR